MARACIAVAAQIFHDNDFEVFVNADGTTHNYKEYEMNSLNQTWDLALNKPYGRRGSVSPATRPRPLHFCCTALQVP